MKNRFRIAAAAGCVVLTGTALGGYALANSDSSAPVPNASEVANAGNVSNIIQQQTPEQRKADIANLPPEQRAGMQGLQDATLNDRIPVSGPKGFAGYITRKADSSPLPSSNADLFPVVDASGTTVAYWAGGGIGVIDKAIVESGKPVDFAALLKERQPKSPTRIPAPPTAAS